MKNSLKQYFTFSSRDRRAILALTCLIVISLLVPFALPYLISDDATDFGEFTSQIEQYKEAIKQQEAEKSQKDKKPASNNAGSAITNEIADFNPNQLTAAQARQLGLPPKVAANIEKYLQKGGKFKKPEDFAKIYGMTDADYQRLRPYLVFEEKKPAGNTPPEQATAEAKNLPPPAPFDPNLLTAVQAQQLGLPPKVAANIEKYLQKGGKFKKPEDFARIYGMTDADYQRLRPFITIAPNPAAIANSNPGKEKTERMEFSNFTDPDMPKPAAKNAGIKIDINTATPEEWDKLPGIGATYANMIVNFRNKLGGFASAEQVKETRGLPEETYNLIAPQLVNNSPQAINKININTSDAATLSKHPYIEKDVAQSIVNIRKQHGNYASVEGIKKSKLIDEALYRKIAPYLTTQ